MAVLTETEIEAIERGDFHAPLWTERLEDAYAELNLEELTPAWKPLIPHPIYHHLLTSPHRFKIVAAGRRSGKTENAARVLVDKALGPQLFPDGMYVAACPTRIQAKRIYWEKLKKLVPRWALDTTRGKNGVSETELSIFLVNGATIMVVGMDHFQALEGISIDFIILDEYASMKPGAWTQTVRPMLSEIGRPGQAWFVGRPRGRNHFYTLVKEFGLDPSKKAWGYYHWKSSDILDPEEIAAAREELDEVSFAQEYEADFVTFEGRIYHQFEREVHASIPLMYDPALPLIFCFDFNVSPGVAAVVQEQYRPPKGGTDHWLRLNYDGRAFNFAPHYTAVIGEVWIPKNSTSQKVCAKLIEDWGEHPGDIYIYGDSTGGAKGTAKVVGTDWDIIKKELRLGFGRRVKDRVPRSNPLEVPRVNAVNARLRTASGTVKLLVDPARAKHVANDLEDVVSVEGGARQIDKDDEDDLTHISDALGYYIHRKHRFRADPSVGGISLEGRPDRAA